MESLSRWIDPENAKTREQNKPLLICCVCIAGRHRSEADRQVHCVAIEMAGGEVLHGGKQLAKGIWNNKGCKWRNCRFCCHQDLSKTIQKEDAEMMDNYVQQSYDHAFEMLVPKSHRGIPDKRCPSIDFPMKMFINKDKGATRRHVVVTAPREQDSEPPQIAGSEKPTGLYGSSARLPPHALQWNSILKRETCPAVCTGTHTLLCRGDGGDEPDSDDSERAKEQSDKSPSTCKSGVIIAMRIANASVDPPKSKRGHW